ncbi:TBC1 domain family member 2A-like [Oppia nitens]|uniref:TBC1 domain family member 2A-like n=1 Tax=Oppia nitens TaxID=1686743 RepID=UPI0023DAB36A|nr:TBC1 domain family member 2A-like [Oppia nitens]
MTTTTDTICSSSSVGVVVVVDDHPSNRPLVEPMVTTATAAVVDNEPLAGYLNKLSSRGPLKAMKKRWFMFNDSNCRLYYYRTRDDLLPLGEIDIKRATFTIKSQTQFTIMSSASKQLTLEAIDGQQCIYWLTRLQSLRKRYIIELANKFGVKLALNHLSQDVCFDNKKNNADSVGGTIDDGLTSRSVFYDDDHQTPPPLPHVRKNSDELMANVQKDGYCQSSPSTKHKIFSGIVHKMKPKTTNITVLSESVQQQQQQQRRTESVSSPIRNLLKLADKSSSAAVASDTVCQKCRQCEDQLVSLSDDMSAIENELQASREVIRLLQKQLEVVGNEKKLLEDICRRSESTTSTTGGVESDDILTKLIQTNGELTDLTIKLRNSESNRESLENDCENLRKQMNRLNEELSVLKEMLESRDETVVSLTHQIYDLEVEKGDGFSPTISSCNLSSDSLAQSSSLSSKFIKVQTNEVDQLKDTVRAYETQNRFLNREIVELNELRNVIELKDKESQLRIYELEAKCSQIQSKLLSLLKEINQSNSQTMAATTKSKTTNVDDSTKKNDNHLNNNQNNMAANESVQALVNRLLEDISLDIPLSWKPGNRSRNSGSVSPRTSAAAATASGTTTGLYDELGFYFKNRLYDDPMSSSSSVVSTTAATTCDDVNSISIIKDNNETSSSGAEPINMKTSEENLKDRQLEAKARAVWKSKWDSFVGNLNNHELQRTQELKAMLRTGIPQEYRCKIWRGIIYMRVKHKMTECGSGYYSTLLKQNNYSSPGAKSLDPSTKQIELDLLRTLPNNKHFETLESDGTARLRRVLTAFSRHNQAVGYCQGLNRLAAVALLFMPEEDAFWCLVAIVESIMPNDYFGRNLLGAHVDQYVLRYLLSEKLPKLYAHLEQMGIELSLFSWFLTAFVDNIPVDMYLRIWDVFLYEGNKILFRFALAFLKLYEEILLELTDSVTINQFLRTLGERPIDVNRLYCIAFIELNPFPNRTVKLKRQHYSQLVSSELQKLQLIRNSLPNHESFECDSD